MSEPAPVPADQEEALRLEAQLARYGKLTLGDMMNRLDATETKVDQLASELREAREALKPFAKLTPSTLHPDDGSDAEGYSFVLAHPADDADFTGEDLARARAALSDPRPSPAKGDDHGA